MRQTKKQNCSNSNTLKVYFEGTDLYTFGIQVESLYLQACLILLNAMVKRQAIVDLWKLLQTVHNNMNTICVKGQLRRLCMLSYILLTLSLIIGLGCSVYFVKLVFQQCFQEIDQDVGKAESGKPPCPFTDPFLLFQKITYTVLTLYSMGISGIFAAFCLIVCILHSKIACRLEQLLERGGEGERSASYSFGRSDGIEMLRLEFEKLCKCSRLMGDYFGLSILAVCVTSLVSITCAIYTVVLRVGIIPSASGTQNIVHFYTLWAFHGISGVLILMLILIPGQMVQNAAEKPSQIILSTSHAFLNQEEKYQVCLLLQKGSGSNFGISACHVTTIGLSFLAAAATNVTTYILVILQFRLGVETQVEEGNPIH